MTKITNTARDEVRPEWLFGGSPKSIEAQEARGQAEMVASTLLPVDVRGREELEAAGVIFGETCKDDPIFCEAILPVGWEKKPTDHDMWSILVDENGKERASIFYKAAFYDRSSFIRHTP